MFTKKQKKFDLIAKMSIIQILLNLITEKR